MGKGYCRRISFLEGLGYGQDTGRVVFHLSRPKKLEDIGWDVIHLPTGDGIMRLFVFILQEGEVFW
jgi:hypothetical protein